LTSEPGTLILVDAENDVENLITFEPWLRSGLNIDDFTDGGVMVGEPFRDEGNRISMMVWGALNAMGKSKDPIVFTSDSPHPGPFDWNQLLFGMAYSHTPSWNITGFWGSVMVSLASMLYEIAESRELGQAVIVPPSSNATMCHSRGMNS
jgi:hypothetical protein